MKRPSGVIYKAVNKINGKVYVGQTVNPVSVRIRQHFNRPDHPFGVALRKYGLCGFDIRVLEECPRELLNDRERHWIAEIQAHSRAGYNLTLGGDGRNGAPHTEATKLKMRNAALGSRNHNFGVPRPPEENEKRSQSLRGKMVGDKNPMYGKRFSQPEGVRQRMREAFSRPEIREARRQRILANNPMNNEDTRRKLSESIRRSWIERRERI